MKTKFKLFAISYLLSAISFYAHAQGTAFTYQGRLNDGGAPANGTYDLVFTIYDLPTGPGAFANQTNSAVAISNGLFTVALNLGLPGIFTGPERWLEIAVRTNGGGSYSNLVPRQKITATPYAITASNLSGTISAGQLSGAIPLAQLPAAVVTNNQSGVNFTGTFAGNGAGVTNLNSENLTGLLTVSNSLVSLGHIDDGAYAYGVAVSGNFAYLANYDDGLRVYNIANPANPVSIGHINDGGIASGVAVSGNFAYLANLDGGLRVYHIANPANPVSVGHINDGGSAQGVAVSGNFACLANNIDGLRVYNIANPTNPVSIGHIDDGGFAQGVAVSGNFAYLANADDGLRVYNIANPTNPVSIGHINDGGFAQGVAVSGNFAYLANNIDGLRVYNIANPTNPVSVGHINDGGSAQGVAVSGNFACLANYIDGLRVYNIANPTNPVSIGHIDDGAYAQGVVVSGTFACLANWDDGLRVYGLGVASAPAFRGDGSLLTGLSADNLSSGTVADARLSANVALRAGGNTFTGNQIVTSGNAGVGVGSPQQQLSVGAGMNIDQNNANDGTLVNTLRFGPGNSGEAIGCKRTPGGNRFGLDFYTASSPRLSIDVNGNVAIAPPGSLSFGSQTRQMLNLWIPNYGIGVQAFTFYQRSDSGFAWFKQGIHSDTANDPGSGGTTLMTLDGGGNLRTVTGTISTLSDRNAKTNFEPVDARDVLERVAGLPISHWRFKSAPATQRHIGPMAQDFYTAFNVGLEDTGICTVDADGVALAAIQGLNQKVEDRSQRTEDRSRKLEEKLEQKQTEITELKARLEKLERVLLATNIKGKLQ